MLLNLTITVIMLLVITTPAYSYLAFKILDLDPDLAELTRTACLFLLPWPAMIGYRRFYQGILIREGASRAVAVGTIVRLICLSATAFTLHFYNILHGAGLGAVSLSVGVSCEALAVRWLVSPILTTVKNRSGDQNHEQLNYLGIWRFYFPLAMTGILGLVAQPLVTLAMNKGRFPLESLAILPVINGLTFFFRAIPLSYQETVISMLGQNEQNYMALSKFAWLLSFILTVILALISFTPLADFWFIEITGLQPELAAFAILPLQLQILTPSLSLLLCWQRSHLIHLKKTNPITTASILELLGIALSLLIGISYFGWIGAVAASVALMIGRADSSIKKLLTNLSMK